MEWYLAPKRCHSTTRLGRCMSSAGWSLLMLAGFFFYLAPMAGIHMVFEPWAFSAAYWFSFATVTQLGFGDYFPAYSGWE